MVAVPAAMPVTTPPVGDTVAAGAPPDHVPPPTVLVSVMEEPVHTWVGPEMTPASGKRFTVTGLVATTVPQLLVTE